TNKYEIADRDFEAIKRSLLFRLTNMGHPVIVIQEGNYRNRAELLMKHRHEGVDLEVAEARDTLRNMHRVWQRPVALRRWSTTSRGCCPMTATSSRKRTCRRPGPSPLRCGVASLYADLIPWNARTAARRRRRFPGSRRPLWDFAGDEALDR